MDDIFRDRHHAGRKLAERLDHYRGHAGVVILGLPRGGVPVAFEVARSLHAVLDVFLVRKLGVPRHAELAMGAIAQGGARVLNQDVIERLEIRSKDVEEAIERESSRLAAQEQLYRPQRPALRLHDRCAILVDDGIATGATMRAAASAVRRQRPAAVVVAAPVGSREAKRLLIESRDVDDVVFVLEPDPFDAVGAWYADFSQTEDAEVRRLLAEADSLRTADSGGGR